MTTRRTTKRPTEEQIDKIVTDHANDDSAWEKSVHAKRSETASLTIPSDLAARAAFLARLHGSSGPDEWVTRIIRERVELEEVALGEARRDLCVKKTREKPSRQ